MDDFEIPVKGDSIEVRDLKPGTQLHIETINSIYDIQIVNDLEIKISGGLLRNGGVRFPAPIPAMLVGSTSGACLKYGRIIHGMRLAVEAGKDSIETSAVTEVSIKGPNWEYSMGWNKEKSMSR
jgi:hypothetical protein